MPQQITILGLNKIGASLGLALGTLEPQALPGGRPVITGWDRDRRVLSEARGRLAIDRAARDAADAVRDADVVFACVPLAELAELFTSIAPHLRHGAVVADTGAAKAPVIELARQHLPTSVSFVGSHPILEQPDGSVQDARLDLFRDAIICLVPGVAARPDALEVLAALVRAIGAKPYYIDAAEHDAYIAGVEQLPLLLSVGLMETLRRSGGWREMQALAGARLRDVTLPLLGDPARGSAACADNSAALRQRLDALIGVLIELRDQLDRREALETVFDTAHALHARWLETRPHMRPGEEDFLGPPIEPVSPLRGMFFGQRRRKPDDPGARRR
ncbi:prephenate dehydrogenase [Kallotenue papyrolyticum]|uniref:prephenate dehydrogenase n=1 Tax=Kallotenue papyrolyticum TaxID=1325125 RepID=UPI0004929501|nr:prephenate dehydrogenase [Kallotenue papyrolyticum]